MNSDQDKETPGTGTAGSEAGTDRPASGAASATGDASATRSEASGEGGPGGVDAGSPGGMGGVRAAGGTGTDRPPGGISPLTIEQETRGKD